jgi:prophage antirepressor-like protein
MTMNTTAQTTLAFCRHEPNGHAALVTREDVIAVNGELYMTARRLGELLEYRNTDHDIRFLYRKHREEIDASRSDVNAPPLKITVPVETVGGRQRVIAFHERAVYLIAMFARTPVARAFRIALSVFLEQYRRERLHRDRAATERALEHARLEAAERLADKDRKIADLKKDIAALERTIVTARKNLEINLISGLELLEGGRS